MSYIEDKIKNKYYQLLMDDTNINNAQNQFKSDFAKYADQSMRALFNMSIDLDVILNDDMFEKYTKRDYINFALLYDNLINEIENLYYNFTHPEDLSVKIRTGHFKNDQDAFYEAVIKELGIENNPKKDIFMSKMWQLGHSNGYEEIWIYAQDLVELIL